MAEIRSRRPRRARRRPSIILIVLLGALVAGVAAAAWMQPFSLSRIGSIRYVGWRYVRNDVTFVLERPRIRAKLAAIGLAGPVERLMGRPAVDSSNINAGVGGSYPGGPVEDAAARAALPLTQTIPGLIRTADWRPSAPVALDIDKTGGWPRAHGDNYSSKYSAATQITPANVGQLRLAWVFDSSSGPAWNGLRKEQIEANPVFAEGLVYSVTPEAAIVALKADSGRVAWVFKSPFSISRRGIVWWPGQGDVGPRIFASIGEDIVAIDARTGRRVKSFGDGGFARAGDSRVAPLVFGDVLIVGQRETGALVGLDARTGAQRWTIEVYPADRNFDGGYVWGGMSLDAARGLVFLATGNPRPALYGASRPGDNDRSSSLIAFDILERKVKWAFQEVRHDLWDYDVPGPPALTTITVGGRQVDVVVAASKVGNIIMLDRVSGAPVFNYTLSRAPASTVPGEQTAAYQPNLSLPEPVIDIAFDPAQVTQVDKDSFDWVTFQVENARYGRFMPPALGETLIAYGVHGGAEWPGVAIDHARQVLYVPVNQIPWKIRLYLGASGAARPGPAELAAYERECQSCHGPNRNGVYTSEGEADTAYVPSLNGLSFRPETARFFEAGYFRHRHKYAAPNLAPTQAQLDQFKALFAKWDDQVLKARGFSVNYMWSQLLDRQGRPGSKPPWGRIVAVDLTSGRHRWAAPFGQVQIGGKLEAVGAPNYGGLIVSAGGVVFATGTADRRIYAFDSASGQMLWSYEMEAAGSAPPTTFVSNGVQYLSVVASGGKFHNYDRQSSKLYTFALGPAPGGAVPVRK